MMSSNQNSLIETYTAVLKGRFKDIDPEAVEILQRLKSSKFEAFLVGGGVRDLLVNLKPKDFDIATNALPNEVRKKVPYCFIIGRRFKLVHARRGEQIFEIATFRRSATAQELEATEQEDRKHTEENFFGNIEEDSFRRDFTINSLFYDPIDEKIIDYCGGLIDIQNRILRMIGDPKQRLLEDPIRALRAVRLSQKLNFSIETSLKNEIYTNRDCLLTTVLPRRREEWIKFFRLDNLELALMELFDLKIFEILLPSLHELFENDEQRREFLHMLSKMSWHQFDKSNPTELFSAVLTAYLCSKKINLSVHELSEDADFLKFSKDELGVFKIELGVYLQALQFISALKKKDAYLKKGERRQRSLLAHPSFDFSLKLALYKNELSTNDYIFWQTEKEKFTANSGPIKIAGNIQHTSR